MVKKMNRMGIGVCLAGLTLAVSSIALADGRGEEGHCSGEHQAKSAEERAVGRFQKADKNNDGFVTHDEVGDKRWEHIKIADTNNDGKVSKAEMAQAFRDGKLGRHGRKPA